MARELTRAEARTKIIQAANRHRLYTNSAVARIVGTYTGRHLQRCVAVYRANRLVDGQVLVAAGFNPHGPRARVRHETDTQKAAA